MAKTQRPAAAAKSSPPSEQARYEQTAEERSATDRVRQRMKGEVSTPRFKVDYVKGTAQITADHEDPATALILLADAMGTGDVPFAEGLLFQLAKASRTGDEFSTREINLALATVHALEPRDATEALLASQMAIVHQATLIAGRKLQAVETIDQQNSASNMFNKLARTFAIQLDSLKRYRSSGEQKVTVHHQHVSVTAQQAVVGVHQRGGGTNENESQSHALGENAVTGPAHARGPALLGHEQAVEMPMPSASCEGKECVPDARRARWCTEGQG